MHVVWEYKHLGIWVSLRLKCVRDAKHKKDQAMASYSPLAVKVFGNRRIRTWLKMALMRSLVLSRSRTEHRLHCGQSETQILASCDDVGTFNAQSPYLEQRETDGVGIAGVQRLGDIGLTSFRTSHAGRDESNGYQFD